MSLASAPSPTRLPDPLHHSRAAVGDHLHHDGRGSRSLPSTGLARIDIRVFGAEGGVRRTTGTAGAGNDLLGYAMPVVREQVGGRLHHRGRAPVVDVKQMAGRAGEPALVLDQPAGRRSRVAVDGLVVVAHAEGLGPRAREQADHQHMGGREVLELIHQQHSAHSAGCGPGGRVGEQHVDGPHDLVVEVDDASLLQRLGVSRSQVREALNVRGVVELDRGRVAQSQPRSAQSLQPCRQRVGHGPAPTAGRPLLYQAVQQVAHFPLVDHLYPAVMCGSDEGASSVAHRQGQAVEGANLQSSEVGGALLHLGAGPHVVGH